MTCSSCGQRRQQMAIAIRNAAKGQSIRPQVNEIKRTLVSDAIRLRTLAAARAGSVFGKR